jgi:hypothetical protein
MALERTIEQDGDASHGRKLFETGGLCRLSSGGGEWRGVCGFDWLCESLKKKVRRP